jgi:hypothetical protein
MGDNVDNQPGSGSAITQYCKNPFAIAGLCLGIASVFLYTIGVVPMLAIIFSGIGLAKLHQYAGAGKIQSWIGLVLGIIFTIMYLFA